MATAPNPTEAERFLAALFEKRAPALTNAPLDSARTEAFRRFSEGGLPHRRIEAYKYTDLKARLRALPPTPDAPRLEAVDAALEKYPPLVEGAARVVIADGQYVPERSFAPKGTRITSILDPEADLDEVGALVGSSDDPLTLANVALFQGGVLIRVDETADVHIEIVHVASEDVLVMSRSAVIVAPGAHVHVTERAVGGTKAVTNVMKELILHKDAHADWVRLSEGRSEDATNLSTLHTRLEEGARLEHLTVSTGTGLSRSQVFAHVVGTDAEANFRAATVAVGKRHADNTYVVRHDAVDSRSSELFRSAVGNGGVAVIQGRIIVDPGAQKTDARMMSNALFLDDTGEVVNKPELEIFADDVQCGHGATSGDLDHDMIFYLRARGIPEAAARRLLVDAFLIEALERVEDEAVHEALSKNLRTWLDVMGGRTWT
ncbi:MAG: SufD family Fe-S cluster assembly protein [Pseudomonadota bacterium]